MRLKRRTRREHRDQCDARRLHVSAGVSYRLLRGVEQIGLNNSDLSGLAATLAVKIVGRRAAP